MTRRMRIRACLAVLVITLAACSPGADPPTAASSEPGASTSMSPPAPSPSMAAPTPAATATASSPLVQAPQESERTSVVIAPEAALAGVELGTGTDDALETLTDVFGAPTQDTGWEQGCPLDGRDDNERRVSWGGLEAQFRRDRDGPGELFAWGYGVRDAADGGPEVDAVMLPGDTRIGDPIGDIAEASGLPTEYDEVFDVTAVGEGFRVIAEGDDPRAPATAAYVPFVPVCD